MSFIIKKHPALLSLLLITLSLPACAGLTRQAPPPAQFSLGSLLPQDQWHLVYLKDQPIGISHFSVSPDNKLAGLYRVESFSLLRYTLLGTPQENSWKGRELVDGELNLQSFTMEGKSQEDTIKLEGKVKEGALYLEKESRGQKEKHRIPLEVPLKSSLAQYFMPLLVGPAPGLSMTLSVFQFDPQNYLGEINITLEQKELTNTGKGAYRITSRLWGLTSEAWVTPQGEVLEEKVLGGLIYTQKVSSGQGEKFIMSQALAKTDLLLDFSLVAADKKILKPENLKSLTLELSGIKPDILPQDERQKTMAANPPDALTVKIIKEPRPEATGKEAESLTPYLASTPLIQSEDQKIESKAKEIVGQVSDPREKARLLYLWVFHQLKKSFRESYTAREVLEIMEGECQSHAKLYAALARSAGLPAKVVNGLVYIPELGGKNGFLYHSWNEVYLGRWVAVDATLGQFPADATHLKLVEGEGLAAIAPLADTIGKLKIKIVGEESRD